MNLRNIKKDIDYVLGAFIEDCTVVAAVNTKASSEQIEKLYTEAADLYNELRDKVNVKEEKPKAYFVALRREILERTDALYEKLSTVIKSSL